MKQFILLLTLLFFQQMHAQTCENFLLHDSVAPIIEGLKQEYNNSISAWPGFQAAKVPIIFSNDRDFPKCVILWDKGQATAKSKPESYLNIPNGLYNFCGLSPMPSCPQVSVEANPESAVLFKLDNVLDGVTALGFKIAPISFLTLAHEAFHYFGQSLQIQQGIWPIFPKEPGFSLAARTQIIKQCYNSSPDLLALTQKEIRSLRQAFNLAMQGASEIEVKAKAQEFLSFRTQRRQTTSDVHILDEGTDRSCDQAESIMELMEGTAEYVGLQSAMNAGLMTYSEVDKWMGLALDQPTGPSEPYYRTGAMALMILNKLNPTGLRESIQQMSKASEPRQTIMFMFSNWAQSKQ